MFQVSARAFAQFPYPGILRAVEAQRAGRRDHLRLQSRGSPAAVGDAAIVGRLRFPVVLVRDPAALAGLVAAVREQATAASPFIMLEQPIDGTPYQIVAHALFASSAAARAPGIHGLHGQHAVAARAVFRSADGTSREDRRQPGRPLDYGVRRRGPGRDEGGAGRARRHRRPAHAIPAPVHRSGARQVDLVASDAGPRVDGARPVDAGSDAPRDAPGRATDVLPDFDRGRREPAGARPDRPRRPGERGAGLDEVRFRRRGHARAEDARGVHPARG